MNLQNANLYLSRKQVRSLYDDWAAGKHEVGAIHNTHTGGSLGRKWKQKKIKVGHPTFISQPVCDFDRVVHTIREP